VKRRASEAAAVKFERFMGALYANRANDPGACGGLGGAVGEVGEVGEGRAKR